MDSLEVQCVARRPRTFIVASLGVAIAASLIAFVASSVEFSGVTGRGFPYGFFGLHAAALAAWGLFSHVQRGAYTRRVAGIARVDRNALVLGAGGEQVTIPRSAIRDGIYRAGHLRLLGPMQRVVFDAEMAEADAQATLRTLGLDAASHRAEFNASSPAFATMPRQMLLMGAVVLLFNALPHAWRFAAPLSSPLLIAALFALGFWPARITAGTDGFMLRWLWWRRFVPMNDVRALSTEGDRGVRLELGSGKDLVWYTSIRSKTTTTAQRDHRDSVLARMQDAHALAKARPRATHLAAAIGRNGRAHPQWLDALRQLRVAEADYRSSAFPRDDLWRVLEDPEASEDERAGAAFVLHTGGDEADELRLRNAAGATVSPRLRIALDSAANGDEAELAAALEDVEMPLQRRAR